MHLRELLSHEGNREENFAGQAFISISTLEQLLSATNVEECFRANGMSIEPRIVQAIVSRAPKLFATLVLLGLEACMPALIDHEIFDDIFPVTEDTVIPSELESHRQDIARAQWIIPPVFAPHVHLKLPEAAVLPFLKQVPVKQGGFGLIHKVSVASGHLAQHQASSLVALKRVIKQEHEQWDTITREAVTLRNRAHPNIVPLLASFDLTAVESGFETRSLNLLFPYADMDMEEWMNLRTVPLRLADNKTRRRYLYESIYSLVSALAFLHREIDGMITSHHDLKPKNILVIGDTLRICDLGRSHLILLADGSETEGCSGLGTFTYHPPEYWNDNGARASRSHGRAFDVWAMGCIMIEMATLIVYSWGGENTVGTFKNNRLRCPNRRRQFHARDQAGLLDYSFHNNMQAVHDWVTQLKEEAKEEGSHMLIQVLNIAEAMLKETPEERLYSWEAELDLYDLLHLDCPEVFRLGKEALSVQPPGPSGSVRVQNPLDRALLNGKNDRAQALLKVGWTSTRGQLSKGHGTSGSRAKGHGISISSKDVDTNLSNAFESDQLPTSANRDSNQNIAQTISAQDIFTQDEYGRTSLHWAALHSDYTTVRSILSQSGSEEVLWISDNFGKRPLHYASEKASAEIISLMLEICRSPETLVLSRDGRWRTPLHWAALCGNEDATKVLLNTGTDKNQMIAAIDDNKDTPLKLAVRRGWDRIEELIEAAQGGE